MRQLNIDETVKGTVIWMITNDINEFIDAIYQSGIEAEDFQIEPAKFTDPVLFTTSHGFKAVECKR